MASINTSSQSKFNFFSDLQKRFLFFILSSIIVFAAHGQCPNLIITINGNSLISNNDGAPEAVAFPVCNTANNLFYGVFDELNVAVPDGNVKIIQSFTTTNVNWASVNGTFLLSDYPDPFNATVSLTNPLLPGLLTATYVAFNDINGNGVVDGVECSSDPLIFTITVNPLPVVNAGADITICLNAPPIPLTPISITGGIFAGLGVTGDVIAGFTFNPLLAGVGAHVIVYTYTDPITGCTSSDALTITVNPFPVLSPILDVSICVDALGISLDAGLNPPGGVFSGPGVTGDLMAGFTFTPVSAGVGVSIITYTYTDPITGCSNSVNFNILVNALPIVDGGTYTVCEDDALLPLIGNQIGGIFLGLGVSGDVLGGFFFDPSVGTQIITYTYLDLLTGCDATDDVTITVNENPALSITLNGVTVTNDNNGIPDVGAFAVCNSTTNNLFFTLFDDLEDAMPAGLVKVNQSFTGVNVNFALSNGTFPLSGYATPFDRMVSLTNPLLPGVLTMTFNAFLDLDNDNVQDPGECSSDPIIYTITVNTPPILSITINGTNITNINDGIADVGSVSVCNSTTDNLLYSTFTNLNLLVPNAQVKVIQNFTLSNVIWTPVNGTFMLSDYSPPFGAMVSLVDPTMVGTLVANYVSFLDVNGNGILDAGECASDPMIFTITVHPLPVVSAGVDLSVCIDAANVVLVGTPPGGIFTGIGVTGDIVNGFTFDPSFVDVFPILYTFTDPFGCIGTDLLDITVNPLPVLSPILDVSICVDALGLSLSAGLNPSGGIFSGPGVTGDVLLGFTFNPAIAGVGISVITYTYTDPVTGCSNSVSFNILVNALPIVDGGTYTVCEDDALLPLIGNQIGGIFLGLGVSGDVLGGFFFDPSVGTQIITYTYLDLLTGCDATDDVTITVNENPALSITLNGVNVTNDNNGIPDVGAFAVCNSTSNNLFFTLFDDIEDAMPPGLVKVNQSFVGVNVNFALSNGTFPLSGYATPFDRMVSLTNPLLPGVLTMTFNAFLDLDNDNVQDPGECSSDPIIYTITVNTLPIVNAGLDVAVCVDAPDVILGPGLPLGGTYSGIGVSGNIITGFTFDPTTAGVFPITYSVTDLLTGCVGTDILDITVNALPIVDAGADITVCVGSPAIPLIGSPIGGIFVGIGVAGNIFTPSIIGDFGITYTYLDILTGCSNSDDITITVVPLPDPDAGDDITVCSNDPDIPLVGLPAGGVFSGIGVSGNVIAGFTFDPSVGTQLITYTYVDLNGCTGIDFVTIVVNQSPILSVTINTTNITSVNDGVADVASLSVCNSTTDNLLYSLFAELNPLVLDAQVKVIQSFTLNNVVWTPVNGTFLLSDYPDPFTAMVSLVDPTMAGTLVITYISFNDVNSNGIQDAGECASDPMIFTITVNPLTVVSAGVDIAVCVDAANVVLVGTPSGGVFTGVGVTGDIVNGFTFDPTIAGIFPILYTFTDPLGCIGTDLLDITVNALPVLLPIVDVSICVDALGLSLSAGLNPSGGVFSGPGVTGDVVLGFTFDPAVAGVGVSVITYTYTDPITGCTSSINFNITVNALPVVDGGSYGPFCMGDPSVPLIGSPIGGIFAGVGVSGDILSGFFFDPTAGTQVITYTYLDLLTGCDAIDDITITVSPTPALSITVNGINVTNVNDGIPDLGAFAVCNSPTDNLFFTVFDEVNGATPANLVKVTQSFTLVNVNFAPANSTFPISSYGTPFDRNVSLVDPLLPGLLTMNFVSFLDLNNNNIQDPGECASDPVIFTVVVNALPVVDAGLDLAVCIDAPDVILGPGLPLGGTYSGIGVSGNIITGFTFDPTTAGVFPITYTVTDLLTGCVGADILDITVNALPVVDAGADITICVGSPAIPLVGSPLGGIFVGIGVVSNIFTPSVVGDFGITYTYLDILTGCSNTDDITISVVPLPDPDAGDDITVCEADADVPLVGLPAGGIFSGIGVSGNVIAGFTFDPSVGTQLITYTYVDLNGCTGVDFVTIVVNPSPILSITINGTNITSINDGVADVASLSVCNSTTDNLLYSVFTELNPLVPNAQVKVIQNFTLTNVVWTPVNGTFLLSDYSPPINAMVSLVDPTMVGTLVATYISFNDVNGNGILDAGECASDPMIFTITVNPLPIVDAGIDLSVCINAANVVLVGTPPGGIFTGVGVTGDVVNGFTFDPTVVGVFPILYTFTDPLGCVGTDIIDITVNPLPVLLPIVDVSICVDALGLSLSAGLNPSGGIFSGPGVTGDVLLGFTFDPAVAGVGVSVITYTYTDPITGCTNSVSFNITVNALPIVDAGTYGPFCMGDPDILLVGSPIGGIFTGIGVSGNIIAGFTFDPSAGMQLITYTFTDINGCTGVDTTTIIASPTPVLSITVNTVNVTNVNDGIPDLGAFAVCNSASDNLFFTLFSDVNGAMPAGLVKITQSFTTVNANFTPPNSTFPLSAYGTPFDRNVSLVNPLLPGLLTMNFVAFLDLDNDNVQDPGECASDPVIFTVVVNPLPIVDAGAYFPVCIDAGLVALVGTPPGGTFTGVGVTGNLFDPTVGTQIITYSFTDILTGCVGTDTALITVNPLPALVAIADVSICIDALDLVLLPGLNPLGGVFSGPGVTGDILSGFVFDPTLAGVGVSVITYVYTDPITGCSNSVSFNITVNALPIVDAGTYASVCQGDADVVLIGSPLGGVFTGVGVTGNLFDPTVGTQVITYTFTDANGCTGTDDVTITVSPTPRLSITLNGTNVTNNNDGLADVAVLSVCDSPADNLFFTVFSDVNNAMPAALVKITQQFTLTNVTFTPPNSTFPLSAYGTPFDRNVQLVNPNVAGTLVMDFVSFMDLNNNDILDAGECASDHVVYTITVNPLPNANIIAPASVCANSTGNIAFVASAGVGAMYNWVITNGTITSGLNTNSITFTAGPSGTLILDVTVTDANGCSDTDTETISIGNLPSISCQGPISVFNDLDECNNTMGIVHPIPSGTCVPLTLTIAFTAGIPAPSTLPVGGNVNAGGGNSYDFFVGQTVVTYTVTDFSGSTATCSFTVTVLDNQLPVIACSGPISTPNTPGTCGAIVNYITPAGTDNCPGSVTTQTTGLASGSTFPVGVTTNTFMVTDASGNTATCSFTVTVVDVELPTIVCPANIAVTNDPGICGAAVIYTAPVALDNCPGITTIQTQGLASGATFPVGVTTNIFLVTDASGNTASCSFTVTVTDTEAPTIPLCPGNIVLNVIDPSCEALASWTVPIPADNCGIFSFGITILPPTPIVVIAGTASGSFGVGVTGITYLATDLSGNTAICAFTITVSDTTLPIITGCPGNIVINNTPGLCSGVALWTAPTASDNCPGVSLVTNHNPGETFPVGVTMVMYTATDASGNTSTCAFTVTVLDVELPAITCPANITVSNTPGLCTGIANFVAPAGTDNCPGSVTIQTTGLPSGSVFPFGVTTNTFMVTDASGNTATCSFTVTVNDTELPVITCPANIAVSNTPDLCSAVVNFVAATGTDNCAGSVVTQIGGLVSGSAFPLGVSVITYTITDASGNTATCTFTITVNDTELPAITCPASIMQSNDPGLCSAIVTYVAPVGTDNCTGSTTIQLSGLPSGATYMVGQTVNVFQVTDASGNTATCSFTITVLETQPPSITCPGNIIANNTPGLCSAVVTYVAPVGTDNCPGQTTAQVGGLASGSTFPVGITTNTFLVTDASGNTASCSFTVTVLDTQAPSIVCPANITVTNDTLLCSAVVSYVAPTGTDNCSGATTTQITGLPSGSTFPVGVTVNTFMVADTSGNTSTCSFTVTVTDDDAPAIVCPGNITVDNDTLLCGAIVNYVTPVGTDNCAGVVTTQIAGLPSGSLFPAGTTTNTFMVSDTSGNTATCSFTVTVDDGAIPQITCQINIVQGNDQDVCKAWVNFVPIVGTDNCDPNVDIYYWTDGATVYGGPDILGQSNDSDPTNDPILGQATPNWYNVGVTNVHYFGVDDSGNISLICNFTITIVDTKIPVIVTCPPSRNVFVNPGTCAGTVPNMVPELIYTDNCNATVTQSPAAGTFFGAFHNATQVVTFTVTDGGGNTATCTATLTLKDNIAPVITTCPPNANVNNNLGVCNGTVPNLIPQIVWTDNCPSATVTQFPAAGTNFGTVNNDTIHVIFILTDAAGNTATCLTILTLKDVQLPTIVCPANITAPCSPPVVQVPFPVTADNCGVVSVINNFNGTGNASGIYPMGVTVVVWTVTDVNGNTATCSHTVTLAPASTVTVSGQGTYCHNGFVSNLTASSATPGTFAWYYNAAGTIPVNPLQVSGPNNSVFTPTGNLGLETVFVILTNPATGCSSLPTGASVNIINCTVILTDPCQCKNNATNLYNGQFDETMTIVAPPGQNWYVVSVNGLFKTTSPAPPAAPTPLSIGVAGTDKPIETIPGMYVFSGVHVDSIGYSITFANGLGDTLTVSNSCYYPNPVIVGVFPDYCQNHPPVLLAGNALPQLPESQRFDLYDATNTIPIAGQQNITVLTPAAISPGVYTLRYTFDAVDNFPTPQYPGCVSTVTQQVKIFPVPPTDLVCGSLSNVSLDVMGMAVIGSDMILQGNYGCFSQYQVDIEGALTNKVSCADIGKTYKVTITDPISGNKCWGFIKVEDKLKPVINCADVTVSCNNDGLDPATIGFPIITDNCTVVPSSIHHTDQITDFNCTGLFSAIIVRQWTAADQSGNQATPCTQTISIKRGTLAEVVFPPNLDDKPVPSLSCENPNTTPANTGVPTIDGKPINGFCELMVAPPSDITIAICENSYKILRTWTVMDACSNNMITGIQVILVKDKVGPSLICPPASAFTYSVNGNGTTCEAIVIVPSIQIQDNCSSASNLIVKTRVISNGIITDLNGNGGILHLPFGIQTFTYSATDNCGNTSTCSVDVNIAETEPPVAVCQQITTVALTNPITNVNASSFDSGSYDECGGPITLTVRRMDNPKCAGIDSTSFGPTVPFFCCDVNNGPVMVALRVTDASGNFNDCMVEVNVVDKLKPAIICPADLTLQCGDPTDPSVAATYSISKLSTTVISNIFANTYYDTITIVGLPSNAKISDLNFGLNLNHEYIDQLTIKLKSPSGTVLNLFQGGTCGQFKKDINATFDDEGVTFFCNGNGTAITGTVKPQISQMSYIDGENPNGKWILSVYDNAPLGGGKVNSLSLNITYNTPISVKPVVTDNTSDCGVLVTWTDLNAPGQCLGNSFINRQWTATDNSGNTRTCIQHINLVDNTPLDIDFPDDVTITDCTSLDSLAGPEALKHSGDCEIVAVEIIDEVFNVVPDACYKIIRTWKVLDWCKYDPTGVHTDGGINVDSLKYDFSPLDSVFNNQFDNNKRIIRDDGDGYFLIKQVIKVIDTDKPEFISTCQDTVILTFAPDCDNNPISLTRLAKDACAPQASLKYTWKLDIGGNGNYDLSGTGSTMNATLPLGLHKAWFRVEDGCGNFDICQFSFTIVDGKKPTPVCINGLSTDLMITGMVTIWAKDFNASSVDNCTAQADLKFSFSSDTTDKFITYDCDSLGSRVVTVWVTDEAGNQDYCVTSILITDNLNACGDTIGMKSVSGTIMTEKADKVGEVQVQLAGSTLPMFTTNNTGTYNFPPMNTGGTYTVVPIKEDNVLNGVSTLDMVLITNHILGKKSLDSPYKMLAADVNNSKNITTADLSEIRKVILHIKPKFTNMPSWRFLDKNFKFVDPKNPWKTALPEVYNIPNLNNDMVVDFIGMKMGDVNSNVKASAAAKNEVRNAVGKLKMMVEEQSLVKDQVYRIPVKAGAPESMIGFQYTMEFDADALEFINAESADLPNLDEENFGLSYLDEGIITSSWNGQATNLTEGTTLFVLNFKAKDNVRLSKSLKISSSLTTAEAYNKDGELMDIELGFSNDNELVSQLELLQNVPNPFNEFTKIGFNLPEDGYAQIVISDISGKVVKMVDGEYARGYNEVKVSKSEIGSNGIYYYQLNTADGSETKKMIIIE